MARKKKLYQFEELSADAKETARTRKLRDRSYAEARRKKLGLFA